VLGLDIEKLLLRQNIEQRTESMLSNSFIQEVEGLRQKYGDSDALVRTTGYAQVIEYLDGYIEKSELSDDIVTATWQLSRKQMTWFRRNKSIQWIISIYQASAMISDYLEDLRPPALIQ
jgi:tRNA dimethylallyltransferase